MKYLVVATKWDDEKKCQVEYVAGEFDNYMNANIFKNAYNEYYKASAKIVKEN